MPKLVLFNDPGCCDDPSCGCGGGCCG